MSHKINEVSTMTAFNPSIKELLFEQAKALTLGYRLSASRTRSWNDFTTSPLRLRREVTA